MRFVRITSKERNPNPESEWGPVVVDLRVDDAGNPNVNGVVFGAMGLRAGNYYYPFAMHPNGNVDFGSGCDERNDSFNILERNIRIGELWTYHSRTTEEDYTYRITSVDPLE